MSLSTLSHEERLRLLRFVCSFAWADLEVTPPEREAVARLVTRMELGRDDIRQVQGWLALPPQAEDVDPTEVPPAHRLLFLDEVRRIVVADGRLTPGERELLCLFERLIS
jgi:uncharacterized tellurite resistance protein B-like protein